MPSPEVPQPAFDDDAARPLPHPVFGVQEPQMSNGERAALQGVLCTLRPALAIEIGTAEGATLGLIAAHAAEVHSFDLVAPLLATGRLDHVTLHTGDSHKLLPRVLEDFAQGGRNVDFVLVDGDHTPEGVRRDLVDLLDSPAIARTTILIHDTTNPTVRKGLDAVDYAAYEKVAAVELDWLPGYIFSNPHFAYELWGGLGCVVVDAAGRPAAGMSPMQRRYVPIAPLLERARDAEYGPEPPAPGPAPELVAAQAAAREQLARGDAEHEMRVAAQRRVAELEAALRARRDVRTVAVAAARRVRSRLRKG